MVAVNEHGYRLGEDHQAARLTDHDVELMRVLFEEFDVGHPAHMGYRMLAVKFGCSLAQATRICRYLSRNQFAVSFKRIR